MILMALLSLFRPYRQVINLQRSNTVIQHIYDLHTHTTFSDGATSPEYLIEKAQKEGYHTGVCDHLFCSGNETPEKINRYLDYVSTLGIPVGGESNIGEELPLTDSQQAKLDYIVASIHAVFPENMPFRDRVMPKLIRPDTQTPYAPGEAVILGRYFARRGNFRDDWEGYDASCAEEYLNLSYKQMVHYMSNFRGEILGHAGVMPFYDDLPYDSGMIIDWENAVVALCKKYNVAMEISGMWMAPYERMLRRAKAEGLKFTFGSDCHRLEDVGEIKYCIKMAELLELTDADMFLPACVQVN